MTCTTPQLHFTEDPDIVTVLVGDNKHPFYAHKQLLVAKIPFFSACLKTHWREDKAKNVELAEECVDSFRVIIRWLYNEDWKLSFDKSDGDRDWDLITSVYNTADRLMIESLQNQVMDLHVAYMARDNIYCEPVHLQELKNSGLAHSKLYEMTLKNVVRALMMGCNDTAKLNDALNTLEDSKAILQEVILGIHSYALKSWEEVWDMDTCAFHVHTNGEKCRIEETETPNGD